MEYEQKLRFGYKEGAVGYFYHHLYPQKSYDLINITELNTAYLERMFNLDGEAKDVQEKLEATQNCKFVITIPIIYSDNIIGVLGIDSINYNISDIFSKQQAENVSPSESDSSYVRELEEQFLVDTSTVVNLIVNTLSRKRWNITISTK